MFYSFVSPYFLNIDPIDYWIFLFAILGEYTLKLSFLAVFTKLPIGAPDYVWNFILNDPYGIHEPDGYFRYGLLVSSFIIGIVLYSRHYRKKRQELRGTKNNFDKFNQGIPTNS